MTATDELRRLLDERGVEHIDIGGMTEFVGLNGRICRAYTRPEPITVDVAVIAAQPEQAIAATLGRGTCKNKATSLRTFWCDRCDCALEDWMDVGGKLINGLRYCPNCGRKVVE